MDTFSIFINLLQNCKIAKLIESFSGLVIKVKIRTSSSFGQCLTTEILSVHSLGGDILKTPEMVTKMHKKTKHIHISHINIFDNKNSGHTLENKMHPKSVRSKMKPDDGNGSNLASASRRRLTYCCKYIYSAFSQPNQRALILFKEAKNILVL